jgi:hypothetical protein
MIFYNRPDENFRSSLPVFPAEKLIIIFTKQAILKKNCAIYAIHGKIKIKIPTQIFFFF